MNVPVIISWDHLAWEGGQLDFPDKLTYEYGNEFKQNIWVINDSYFKEVG